MGKIADSYVEIGARPSGFENWVNSLSDRMKGISTKISEGFQMAGQLISQYSEDIIDNLTGISGAGAMTTQVLSGLGSIVASKFAVALAAVAAVTVAIDQLYSRSEDQQFEDSVRGLSSGFRGLSEEIAQTDKRIKAIMESDATGAGGGWFSVSSWKALLARMTPLESMTSQIARNMANAETASGLFAQNLAKAATASQAQKDQQVGAQMQAGQVKTAAVQNQENTNARAFKNVLDEQGGQAVFNKLRGFYQNNRIFLEQGQSPMEAAQVASGKLARGDIATTQLFDKTFGIASERAKVLADDFEKATGAAEELAAIERQKAEKQKQFEAAALQRQQQETQKAAQDMQRLQEQQDAMAERREAFEQARNERQFNAANFQDLASARDNLFLAAKQDEKDKLTEKGLEKETDRVVKALDKIYEKFNMKMN